MDIQGRCSTLVHQFTRDYPESDGLDFMIDSISMHVGIGREMTRASMTSSCSKLMTCESQYGSLRLPLV